MTYHELERRIVEWADSTGITEHLEPRHMIQAIHKTVHDLHHNTPTTQQDRAGLIGDLGLSLIVLCHMAELDFLTCLAGALSDSQEDDL